MPNKLTQQFTKLKQEKKLFWMMIFALVAVVVWIVVSILSTRKEQVISAELIELAKPLVPTLDRTILEGLNEKDYFTNDELERFSIFALVELEDVGGRQLIDIVDNRVILLGTEEDAVLQSGETSGSDFEIPPEGGVSNEETEHIPAQDAQFQDRQPTEEGSTVGNLETEEGGDSVIEPEIAEPEIEESEAS